jgi:hypothetical protein
VALLLIAEIVLWGAGPHFWELVRAFSCSSWRLT